MNALAWIGDWCLFAARSARAAGAALLLPSAVIKQMHGVLIGALPLAVAAGITLGAVIWMHTHAVLARTGTVDYLPSILAVAVLLELAPLGAGLIVAARSGSRLGAELGAMRLGEQIDALEMLGISPMKSLVGPRVLSCMIALPLVHIIIAALALFSGYVAESLIGHGNWLAYQTACLRELNGREVFASGLKTIVFGFMVGVAGCYEGLHAEGGTEGVGVAATSAVVQACLLVLCSDVFMVGTIRLVL